jgi:hypothetical protein
VWYCLIGGHGGPSDPDAQAEELIVSRTALSVEALGLAQIVAKG